MLKFLGGGATFIQGGTSIPESRVSILTDIGCEIKTSFSHTLHLCHTKSRVRSRIEFQLGHSS